MRNLLHAKGKAADSCQSSFTGRASLVSSRRKEKGTNMLLPREEKQALNIHKMAI